MTPPLYGLLHICKNYLTHLTGIDLLPYIRLLFGSFLPSLDEVCTVCPILHYGFLDP
jgi:hypothetical protein